MYDLSTPETLKDFEEIDRVKNLFDGDEGKALEYVLAKKKAEAGGAIDGIVETIEGTTDIILHPIDTAVGIYDAVVNYEQTYDAIKVSANEWMDLYAYALKNDPTLAGEMMGYIEGKVGGVAAAKVIQKVAILRKTTINNLLTSSQQAFKENQLISNAGRAVTKHPEYFGFDSTKALRQVYKTDAALNELANSTIKEILSDGIKTTGAGGHYPNGWITYTLKDGRAASWSSTGEFIGFRGVK